VYLQQFYNIGAENDLEQEKMKNVSYALTIGNLMYA